MSAFWNELLFQNFDTFKWHAGDLLFFEIMLYKDHSTRARWSCRNRESVGGSASANVEASSEKHEIVF